MQSVNIFTYNRMASTKSPSFCMTINSASLTNLTARLLQSHDSSCYVSRPILAPPALWLHTHTDLRSHDFVHFPDLWHQPRLANVTCARSWRLCGITPFLRWDILDGVNKPQAHVLNQSHTKLFFINLFTVTCFDSKCERPGLQLEPKRVAVNKSKQTSVVCDWFNTYTYGVTPAIQNHQIWNSVVILCPLSSHSYIHVHQIAVWSVCYLDVCQYIIYL
jgi:hypothetical protein